ncbi:CyP450 monooxygenase [Trametes maxima]|nr:CyP450 monooxygenase [Trametes maxima]
MLLDLSTSTFIALATVVFLVWKYTKSSARRLPLPPGPRPLPIVGNVLDVPTKSMEIQYGELCRKYGDLVYLNVLGQSILVLGSHQAAVDLLDKRSALYSDRPESPIIPLGGFDYVLSTFHYGPWWRRHRRMFHQFFNPNAVHQFRPRQRAQLNRFLLHLVNSPGDFIDHIRHLFAATILPIAYGVDVQSRDDEIVVVAEKGLAAFSELMAPGKYLAQLFPQLDYLPKWMPGAQFKRDAERVKRVVLNVRDVPWARSVAAMRNGTAQSSMATALMERIAGKDGLVHAEEEEVVKNTLAVVYGAGADTTLAATQSLFLALASFPEVLRKAQAELDSVVGPSRMPDFTDEDALPYVSAVTKECLRWHIVAPLALPHRLIEDDEYRGYFIPKGTIVLPNLWAYGRDENVYPEPREFKPERFLKDGKLNQEIPDPSQFAFGYGRRVCPGRHFAEASLFLTIACVLHTLDVSAPLDAHGNPVRPAGKVTSGVISYPEPFECVIKPRGPWAEALIRASNEPKGHL